MALATEVHPGTRVGVSVLFLPLKAFEGEAELRISKKNGLGRWRLPLHLTAELGAVDGMWRIDQNKK